MNDERIGRLSPIEREMLEERYVVTGTREILTKLELAEADDLDDTDVACLAEQFLKFLADRATPVAWAGNGSGMPYLVESIIQHMQEALKTYPLAPGRNDEAAFFDSREAAAINAEAKW